MLGLIAPGNYIGTLEGATLKTVTTAGTEVQLTTSETPCEGIILQALETNSGLIVYGGSDVVADAASRKGIALAAGESVFLPVKDVARVYIDATANGDKACYLPLR